MDTRNGQIYDNYDAAKLANVPDDFLVQGSERALKELKTRIRFTGGSFKTVPPKGRDDRP